MFDRSKKLAVIALLIFHALSVDAAAQVDKQANQSGSDTLTGAKADPPSVAELTRQSQPSVVVITVGDRDGKNEGVGTGFVVTADGLIATNLHVIGESRPIRVHLADGRELKVAEVRASDRSLDLAVIRAEASDLKPLQLAQSPELTQGQRVVAIGNPLGFRHSVVEGVISGLRNLDGRDMIQLAMPIEPGNSGGPVLDRQGNVVGIVTMKSAVTQNLGFAVRVDYLRRLLDSPNPIPMSRWLSLRRLDQSSWKPIFGASWRQRSGQIQVRGSGKGFGGRSLCLSTAETPPLPYELAVTVRMGDETGAAGLVFHSDGADRHYGFYPSAGKIRLTRFDGPTVYSWNVLHEVATEHYQPREWNHLKVRFEPEKILCYVNNNLVITSSDKVLKQGRAGLAQFRGTPAQFRDFELGEKISSHEISTDQQQRIARQLDDLLQQVSVSPTALERLADDAPLSSSLLHRRAKALEEQAARLRDVAQDVHTRAICTKLADLVGEKQPRVDLARAALLISQLDNADLDVKQYLREIDRMAEEIKEELEDGVDESVLHAALKKYLFAENGFHGSRLDYDHRANRYLDRVIDDREGLPITLSVLYMELAHRLGLTVEGVGLPAHFIVRYVPRRGEPQLIDVFSGGKDMTHQDAERMVLTLTGAPLEDWHLKRATAREIGSRMLRNLLTLAERSNETKDMLRYVQAMVAVDPEDSLARGKRALLRYRVGQREQAIADLDWFLEHQPEGVDLDAIRQMRSRFEAGQ